LAIRNPPSGFLPIGTGFAWAEIMEEFYEMFALWMFDGVGIVVWLRQPPQG
jgi:hypothetical protein